jgi:hypothetical protein
MRIIFVITILFSLTACESSSVATRDLGAQLESRAKNGERYLAYEHHATVDLPEELVAAKYGSVIEACAEGADISCTVLDSEITSGRYTSASIKMRLSSDGVEEILALASENGAITRRSTHVEDLAEPIIDSEKQLAMLEAYLDDLSKLRSESQNNVDALIRVTAEIADTQSRLDSLRGENAYLQHRVNLDALHINFVVETSRTFSAPITNALVEFGDDLSAGIAEAITGFAFLLPWLFILIPIAFLIRFLWKKVFRSKVQ